MTIERFASILAKYLQKLGTRHVFVYPGLADLPLLSSIKYETNIQGIYPRKEDQAVFMADGYWRASRDLPLGVVITTQGPGLMYALAPLNNAFLDSSALLHISGTTPTLWVDRGRIQELYRHGPDMWEEFIRPIVKRAFRIPRPEIGIEIVAKAHYTSISGRPGPTSVLIPNDVMYHYEESLSKKTRWVDPTPYTSCSRVAPCPYAITKAVDLVLKAERPLILAGGGVHNSRAWEELRSLVETFTVPMITTFMGKGALPEDHPLNLGVAGACGSLLANKAAMETDVLIAVGARFSEMHTIGYQLYKIPTDTKLIHVDIDPTEINRVYPAEVGIIADAKIALKTINEALLYKVGKKQLPPESWLAKIKKYAEEWDRVFTEETSKPNLEYSTVFSDVSKIIKEVNSKTTVFADTGLTHTYAPPFFKAFSEAFSTDGHMAQMGFAPAGIIGAKLKRPDHPAVSLSGDGPIFMVGSAISTAVENEIPVVWVVMENKATYIETVLQEDWLQGEAWSVWRRKGEPYNPDIVKMTESMGARAVKVKTRDEFRETFKEALKSPEPFLIDVPTPWVRGWWAGPPLGLHVWPLPIFTGVPYTPPKG
ncbi:MAG: thiamine pyrophosphate-binding protein [Desulfurococcaceae archaeon]